ncbi:MAG: lipid II flippase MurJ [Coriobacteriia bacterium]|nr:lipid II flippase MurJ [Coriobacteriia bacterium]
MFYGAGAVISGLLNAQRRFLWPALGPVFNNLVVIATMFAYVRIAPAEPVTANWVLAIGTTLGVLVMFGVQLPALIALRPSYTWRIDLSHPGLKAMGLMAVPTLIYVATNLVAVSFRNAYAFAVAPEGPATLSYAWMFYQLPYGVLAVALATAVFTELSQAAGQRDTVAFRQQFARGLRATAMLILPPAALLIALAQPLVTLYRAGRFTTDDIPMVASVLQWWAVGLFFFAAFMFILKSFYSLKDTRTPMLANLALVGLHIGLYALLTTGGFGFAGLGLIGIPIADATFYGVGALLLGLLLRRKIGEFDAAGIARVTALIVVASALGGAAAWIASGALPPIDGSPGAALLNITISGGLGLTVAWVAAALMRVPEVSIGLRLVGGIISRVRGKAKR